MDMHTPAMHTPAHTPAASSHDTDPYEALFTANLPVVREAIRAVCRRCRVSPDEEAEFTSSVIVKLIDNGYEVFRRFRGGSELRTFLFAVAYRHLLDLRNSEWGKWRPSKCARRLGSAAVCLEELVFRERTALPEAVAIVANHPRWGLSTNAVRSLYAQLPPRTPRRRMVEPLDGIAGHMADGHPSEREREERQREAARVHAALAGALRRLDRDDRRLLRLRFQEGLSMMEIATATATPADAPALYRRLARILRRLRQELQEQQLTSLDVCPLLGHAGEEFDALLARTWDERAR
jgi:RNA polymerase sigma factor (sigma-70 family)